MEADKHWVPKVLAGEMIKGDAWYDGEFQLTNRGVEIETVKGFED